MWLELKINALDAHTKVRFEYHEHLGKCCYTNLMLVLRAGAHTSERCPVCMFSMSVVKYIRFQVDEVHRDDGCEKLFFYVSIRAGVVDQKACINDIVSTLALFEWACHLGH